MNRYFKSTFTRIVWRFSPEGAANRMLGEGGPWIHSAMTVEDMGLCAFEITAEEGES